MSQVKNKFIKKGKWTTIEFFLNANGVTFLDNQMKHILKLDMELDG